MQKQRCKGRATGAVCLLHVPGGVWSLGRVKGVLVQDCRTHTCSMTPSDGKSLGRWFGRDSAYAVSALRLGHVEPCPA